MLRSLFSAVSALRNHQVQMDVIGNNVANVNTVAFKSSRCLFQDMLSQTLKSATGSREGIGGTNPQQVGLGMSISSIDKIFSQGNLMSTQKKTDLAIQGNGFFILSDGVNRYYTRAGAFDFDINGNFISPKGYMVQGYMAEDGVLGEVLDNIKIDFNQRLEAKVTTQVDFVGNLNSDIEPTSASSSTLLTKLFDKDGNSMSLHIGDTIDINGEVITSAKGDTKLIYLVDNDGIPLGIEDGHTINFSGHIGGASLDEDWVAGSNSTLEDLRAELETKLQAIDSDITVEIVDGRLKVTAGTDSINLLTVTDTTTGKSIFTFEEIPAEEAKESNESRKVIMPAVGDTKLIHLLDNLGKSLGIEEGDKIGYSGEVDGTPIDVSDFDVGVGSTLENLRKDLQDKLRAVTGDYTITVEIVDGKLKIDNSSGKDITNLKLKNGTDEIFIFEDILAGETKESNAVSRGSIATTYTITEKSSLSDLAYEVQNSIRAASGGEEIVTVRSDGSLQVTADIKDITDLKMTSGTNAKFNAYGIFDAPINAGETSSTPESRSADYTTFVTAYDSLGKAQIVTLLFAKDTSGLSNTWHWQAIVPYQDEGDVSGDKGTLTFNSDGSISGGETARIIFDPDGKGIGADEMKINLGFGTPDKFDGVTQFASPFTATLKEQNGYTSGILDDIAIDNDGVITGIFTNGVNRTLAQIVLSDFSNPGGLSKAGDNLYQQTMNSGLPQEGKPGTGSRGMIAPSTLEMSNVDLAQSFTEIIIAQRGFQVNARVITASDQILQELVNLKR